MQIRHKDYKSSLTYKDHEYIVLTYFYISGKIA